MNISLLCNHHLCCYNVMKCKSSRDLLENKGNGQSPHPVSPTRPPIPGGGEAIPPVSTFTNMLYGLVFISMSRRIATYYRRLLPGATFDIIVASFLHIIVCCFLLIGSWYFFGLFIFFWQKVIGKIVMVAKPFPCFLMISTSVIFYLKRYKFATTKNRKPKDT